MGEMNTFLTSSHPSLVKLSSKLEGSGDLGRRGDSHPERDGGSSLQHHHRKGGGVGSTVGSTAVAAAGRCPSEPDVTLAVKEQPSSSSTAAPAATAPLTSSDPRLGSSPRLSLAATADADAASPPTPDPSGVVSPEHPPVTGPSEESTTTTTSTSGTHPHPPVQKLPSPPPPLPPLPSASAAPLKATSFAHLRLKYLHELEYMLTEFQKLERQLLGAKAATRESDGSRERREKLHSFIVHLQDTIQQIKTGCQLESEGKSTVPPAAPSSSGPGAEDGGKGRGTAGGAVATKASSLSSGAGDALKGSALLHLTTEKREEETVQKLEEHILANLLPVKVRLKKQLAAQQGAKHNPAGMPVRGTALAAPPPPSSGSSSHHHHHHHHHHDKGKATFAAAAAATTTSSSSSTKFGMPLEGGGSCLTQKLHGPTLGSGSANRLQEGSSVPAAATTCDTKIRYAGLAIGSDQHESSVTAASAVHEMVIKDPTLMELARHKHTYTDDDTDLSLPDADQDRKPLSAAMADEPDRVPSHRASSAARTARDVSAASAAAAVTAARPSDDKDPVLRRLVKKKRKRRKLREEPSVKESQQQSLEVSTTSHCNNTNNNNSAIANTKKGNQGTNKRKKRGPWPVEYMCALCNEVYGSTCEYNPWWALQQQECPKCHKTQIPRIDIGAPANAIEYHPALLAHAEEHGTGAVAGPGGPGGGGAPVPASPPPPAPPSSSHVKGGTATFPATTVPKESSDSESTGSDLSDEDWEGLLSEDSDDDTSDSDLSDPDVLATMSPVDQAEHERFGDGYTGPKLSDEDSSRLLVLMAHAATCPCQHKVPKLRDVCLSTKWMMLHVRDCPGTTSTFDVCPFPWCRKVKHLLYHLVSCQAGEACPICNPEKIHVNLRRLQGLNKYRLKRHRERLISRVKAASSAAKIKAAAADEATSSNPMEIVPLEAKSLDPVVDTGSPSTAAGAAGDAAAPSDDKVSIAVASSPMDVTLEGPGELDAQLATPSARSDLATASQVNLVASTLQVADGTPGDENEASRSTVPIAATCSIHSGVQVAPSPLATAPLPCDDSKVQLENLTSSGGEGSTGDSHENELANPVQDSFLPGSLSVPTEVGAEAASSTHSATDCVNPECNHTVVTDSSSSYSAPLDTEVDSGGSCNVQESLECQGSMAPDLAAASKEDLSKFHGKQSEPLSVP